ncbi:MAG TPA: lysophospholipid acyltransferase family protein [Candidatus Micrarchaeia archaeon]|nr:lysophospholipid acyltransferase family protein [Candidatus Micrarchaeia archaeon]
MTAELPQGVRLDLRAGPVMLATQATLRWTLRRLAGRHLVLDGLDRIPPSGPLLVCSNHHSYLDPCLIGGFFPRDLHAMAKAELYRNPLLRQVCARCHCIPVSRGSSDRQALRGALAVLGAGGALLVFPEGTRSQGLGLLPATGGVGFLARLSAAPILPIGVWGTEQALPRHRRIPRPGPILLRVGEAFRPRSREKGAIGEEVMRAIAALLPAPYRGRYG